jgi:hypothetical protein
LKDKENDEQNFAEFLSMFDLKDYEIDQLRAKNDADDTKFALELQNTEQMANQMSLKPKHVKVSSIFVEFLLKLAQFAV